MAGKSIADRCESSCRVQRLKSEEDSRAYGHHALALRPRDGRGRTWILSCDSKRDLVKWKACLRFAGEAAHAPLSDESCARAAFIDALRRTRHELQLWGQHEICFNESRELLNLVRHM